MKRHAGILVFALGVGWAQSLLVLGLWLLFATALSSHRLIPAAGLIAAGLFVAMGLVIDRLVPDAQPGFVGLLKHFCTLLCYTATAVSAYAILTGRAALLFLPH